jgi:hypothetical protein
VEEESVNKIASGPTSTVSRHPPAYPEDFEKEVMLLDGSRVLRRDVRDR